MFKALRRSAFSAVLCLFLVGANARAELITIDLPELTGTFTHGQAPFSATVDFGEVEGEMDYLSIVITGTGTSGYSDVEGELPAEVVVSAVIEASGYEFIRPTVLGPFGETPTTLEAVDAILYGDLDSGGSTGGSRQVIVTLDTNDIYSGIITAPAVEISSVTVTAGFTTAPDCGWIGCEGFVGIEDLNRVLSRWNETVTPGDWLSGDISGDGFVGIEDLNIVLSHWNAGTPPAAVMPEPAAFVLLGLGVFSVAGNRRS